MKLQMSASQFAERIGKIDTIEQTASEKVGEAPADGNEYVRKDGTWTKPDKYSKAEADETFLKKTETPTLDNVYTKAEVDEKLANIGSYVTSESVAQQISAALVNYVEKVTGKDLSSNDFTTELKEKLEGLSNYDDTAVQESLTQLSNRLDTLVGTSASEAIDTFNEIEAFLQGITDTKTLTGLLAELKAEVVAAIPTSVSQLTNDAGFISNETDPTVPDWAKQPEKPTYTAEEVGALSSVPQASDTVLGGVKIGYVQNEKNYPVELDAEGKAFVSVLWDGDINIGVSLDAKPTEDTLTYTKNNTVKSFVLGMSAIYPDSESDDGFGISFFKGITESGKAIWGKGGGGNIISAFETVIISLISNQDENGNPDADFIGKNIHVVYENQDKILVWNGEVVKTTVPINMEYQVIFPTDDRYTCPETQTYRAVAGENREVNGYYLTEKVIINVTCDDDTSVENQKLTINDTVYDLDSTGVFVIKFPFGSEYTVSVDVREGYTAPNSVTFTTNSKERVISMEYTFLDYGVYIEATDHTLYKYTQWNGSKTANCLVVKHPTNSFRISFIQTSVKRIYSGSNTIYIENIMKWFSSEEYAKSDMNTEYNNEKMISAYGSSSDYLAGYFNSLYLPDRTTKCLLPALGWWQIAYDNKVSIDACISTLNKTAINTDVWYWSSSLVYHNNSSDRYFATKSWLGSVDCFGPTSSTPSARAFAAYN